MPKTIPTTRRIFRETGWMTVRESVKKANELFDQKIRESDIYRYALHGDIFLSIYFQSPVIIRKIKTSQQKLKLSPINSSFINRLCLLDKDCFLNGINLTFSTEGDYIYPHEKIIDTMFCGYEYVLLQQLLAKALKIPLLTHQSIDVNYGITVTISNKTFQVFERLSRQTRVNQQIMRLTQNAPPDVYDYILKHKEVSNSSSEYFPVYELPQDACFVLKQSEFQKLGSLLAKKKPSTIFIANINPHISFIMAGL